MAESAPRRPKENEPCLVARGRKRRKRRKKSSPPRDEEGSEIVDGGDQNGEGGLEEWGECRAGG